MTDPDLTPEQEAAVRRLLADARHTDPTPDAVVARLDRVLAGLADEPSREADVVRLADRRRKVATILVGAAASVAAVIGIGQVVSNTGVGGSADSATSAESGGEAENESAEEPQAQADTQSDRDSGEGAFREDALGYRATQRKAPLDLSSDRFADDAESLASLARGFVAQDYQDEVSPAEPESLSRVRDRSVCEPGSWGRGSYVAVLYDGAEGWVVLRQPQNETQIADLFLCGSENVVRSVTLPLP